MLEIMNLSQSTKQTFKERAWTNFLRRNFERTKWYFDDIEKLSESNVLLNEFDAAKEIMKGTILGNYRKKISNLKVNTELEFKKQKEEFVKIYN